MPLRPKGGLEVEGNEKTFEGTGNLILNRKQEMSLFTPVQKTKEECKPE